MDKNRINRKIKLLRAGLLEVEVARMLGVTRQLVNAEMRGIKKSRRVRDALCRITKTTPEKLFPEHAEAIDVATDNA